MIRLRLYRQFIEAAQRGQPDAIAELLAVCQPDIKWIARRTCSHADDAEDAVPLGAAQE